jgi:bifunctional non-homologous end joining protein LigD
MTRDEAVDYYRRVAKFILPHLRNRPVSFKRFPGDSDGESYWEKNAPSFTPDWVRTVPVPRRSGESDIDYIVINDAKTLMWVASVGGIEIHPFLHRWPNIDTATEIVFDLDPGTGADILDCCRVAVILRDALNVPSFVKVSGSKGLQVYVPVRGKWTHDQTEDFARGLADELARKHPRLIVSKMAKHLRAKKVFIDWSQNADYKTTIAVYSLRATGFVSMPMKWSEIENAKEAAKLYFTAAQALKRLARIGDLWKPLGLTRAPSPPLTKRAKTAGLPNPDSQSGRRLFLLVRTEMGNELWIDRRGKFRRWILRPDRQGGPNLIAMPAGQFPIEPEYARAEVPKWWKGRVTIEDAGAYETVAGSEEEKRFDLFFIGKVLSGRWSLEKVTDDEAHRSWRLSPSPPRR